MALAEVRLHFQTHARQRANVHLIRMCAPPSLTHNLNQVPPSRRYRKREIRSRLRNSIFGLFCPLTPQHATQQGSTLNGKVVSLSAIPC